MTDLRKCRHCGGQAKQYTIEGRNLIGKPGARRLTGGNRGIYDAKEEGRK